MKISFDFALIPERLLFCSGCCSVVLEKVNTFSLLSLSFNTTTEYYRRYSRGPTSLLSLSLSLLFIS